MSNNPSFAFSPTGAAATATTSAGASSAAVALSSADCDSLYIINTGADVVRVAVGDSSVSATSTDFPVAANGAVCMAMWGLKCTHFAVYSATGSIIVSAQKGRGGFSLQEGSIVSSGVASPVQVQRYTAAGAGVFVVPSNINTIYLSGAGGGGGGAGGASNPNGGGGGGGGCGIQVWLLPVSVTPGGTIDVFVGSGGNGGAAASDGNDGTDSYIVGHTGTEILSPYADSSNYIKLGPGKKGSYATGGGNGGGTVVTGDTTLAYGTQNTGAGHSSRWWFVDGQTAMGFMLPICQAAGGGATNNAGGSRNAAGFLSINGNGLGLSGLGGASWGGGGAGGGGGFARGGAGGASAGAAGGIGGGYGGGGGGGAGNTGGTGGVGGAGAKGIIELWY